ncbi:hypothetical protein MHU86_12293 [Fragilaria crotonensis]|nr:hypothetical protein MHU86_12293 [Fragilaria crotonensis]
MTSPVLLRSTLQRFFRQEEHNLSKSPILLISSLPESSKAGVVEKTIETSIDGLKFYGQQQLGLPVFTTQIRSAFCTSIDIENVQKLKKRTGASIIIGAGSGAAMDLAKAAVETRQGDEKLYLFPSTSAAVLASFTSISLVLDTKEEIIIMKVRQGDNAMVVVDEKDLPVVVHPHALAACQAILLDAALRDDNIDLSKAMTLMETLQYTAANLSTGLGDQTRSVPLCLASSLIPPLFSSTHIFTFWASLVPALMMNHARALAAGCDSVSGDTLLSTLKDEDPAVYPALAALALEAQSVESMLQHIRNNQFTTRDVHDVSDEVLIQVLSTSLNR